MHCRPRQTMLGSPLLSLSVLVSILAFIAAQDSFFCGTSWADTSSNCDDRQPCPGATDAECSTPGHVCWADTLCSAAEGHGEKFKYLHLIDLVDVEYDDVSNTRFCGSWWAVAEESCSIGTHCPDRTGCPEQESCYEVACHIQDIVQNELGDDWKAKVTGTDGSEARMSADDPRRHNYCGLDWSHASGKCTQWCNGDDTDCPGGQTCYADTDCYYDDDLVPTNSPIVPLPPTRSPIDRDDPANRSFCGATWTSAIAHCSPETHCKTYDDCPAGHACFQYLPGCNLSLMVEASESEEPLASDAPKESTESSGVPTGPPGPKDWRDDPSDVANFRFCGVDWSDATSNCSLDRHCPDHKCEDGLTCFNHLSYVGSDKCNAYKMYYRPTEIPSSMPTQVPTFQPTTASPTKAPTSWPTKRITNAPTSTPSAKPILSQTDSPASSYPTYWYTYAPTTAPKTQQTTLDQQTMPDAQDAQSAAPKLRPTTQTNQPELEGIASNGKMYYCATSSSGFSCDTTMPCNVRDLPAMPCSNGQICVHHDVCKEQQPTAESEAWNYFPDVCPLGFVGVRSRPGDCEQYHECNNGYIEGSHMCDIGLLFHNKYRQCMDEKVVNSNCESVFSDATSEQSLVDISTENEQEPDNPPQNQVLLSVAPTAALEAESDIVDDGVESVGNSTSGSAPERKDDTGTKLCPTGFTGLRTYDCINYYECVSGHIGAIHACETGYKFDQVRGTCISGDLVGPDCNGPALETEASSSGGVGGFFAWSGNAEASPNNQENDPTVESDEWKHWNREYFNGAPLRGNFYLCLRPMALLLLCSLMVA